MGRNLERFLSLVGFVAVVAIAPVQARASGDSFWETMGFSVAMGTVLGASTLPFYDQPGQHLSNLLLGAAAGAVFGVGWEILGGSKASDEAASRADLPTRLAREQAGLPSTRVAIFRSPAIWTPLVSYNW